MNKSKIIAVTLVTALCLLTAVVPASASSIVYYSNYSNDGLFVPTPSVPDSSSLPYGANTQIIELYNYSSANTWQVYRFYFDASYSANSSLNIPSVSFATNRSTYKGILFIDSKSPVYMENFWYTTNDYVVHYYNNFGEYQTGNTTVSMRLDTKLSSTPQVGYFHSGLLTNKNTIPWNGKQLITNDYKNKSSDILTYLNNRYNGGFNNLVISWTTRQYITPSQANKIANDESFSRVEKNIIDSVNSAKNDVVTVINQAADKIVNAGSDSPALNTEQNGLTEVISNLNKWVSDLGEFENQMKSNEAENSENMAQAKGFINGFFSIVPPALIACFSLFLVIIVVVKLVGR